MFYILGSMVVKGVLEIVSRTFIITLSYVWKCGTAYYYMRCFSWVLKEELTELRDFCFCLKSSRYL